MSYWDLYHAQKTMNWRLEDERLHLEESRLRRKARLTGALQQGRMAQRGCWLLCQMGRLLVAIGMRLEQYGLSQTLSLEGELS